MERLNSEIRDREKTTPIIVGYQICHLHTLHESLDGKTPAARSLNHVLWDETVVD